MEVNSTGNIGLVDEFVAWRSSPIFPIESLASQRYSLLQLLATAHQEQIPMGPLVLALSREHRYWNGRDLRLLANALMNRCPLGDAIRALPNVLSEDAVIALQLPQGADETSRVFEQLLNSERPVFDDAKEKWFGQLIYWSTVAIPMIIIVAGFFTFIVPTFYKIFDELEIRQSPFLEIAVHRLGRFLVPIFFLAIVLPLFWAVYYLTPIRHAFRRQSTALVASLFPRTKRRLIQKQVAIAVASGLNVANAIEKLSEVHLSDAVRRTLKRVLQSIDKGNNEWQALAEAKLLEKDQANAISQMHHARERGWVLQRLADEESKRVRKRFYVFVTILHPLVITCCGLVVLLICLAGFEPLVRLLDALSYHP
jgi:type II secretory pathway component PulF